MTRSRLSCTLAFLAAVLLCVGAPPTAAADPPLPNDAAGWSAAARRDVQAAYQLMAENHPGMFNAADPEFPARLKAARTRGLRLAGRVRDAAGFSAALDGFSAVLRDGHARVVAALPDSSSTPQWPGFVAVWRGDRLRVFASDVRGLPVGAAILSCDGREVRSLVLANVFAFGGNPDVPGDWWARAGDLFSDDGNPFIQNPQRCRVLADGKTFDLPLEWRPIDSRFKAWREQGFKGETLPIGLTAPRPRLLWLAMPTFSPKDAQRTAYRDAFEELHRRRAEVLAADAVVIDLRGNHGGSSFWSQEAARSLWGAARVDSLEDPSRVWWRASPGNTRYLTGLGETLRANGQPEMAAFADRVAKGMTTALVGGQPYWIESGGDVGSPKPAASAAPELQTPVYVIVPGYCASACLDAVDLFTRFPNTKLIGAPSSADTVYLEVRVETLPDGMAKVVIPNKLYRNRPRRSGESYKPAIEVDDLEWSTAAFRKVVEADLRSGADRKAVARPRALTRRVSGRFAGAESM